MNIEWAWSTLSTSTFAKHSWQQRWLRPTMIWNQTPPLDEGRLEWWQPFPWLTKEVDKKNKWSLYLNTQEMLLMAIEADCTCRAPLWQNVVLVNLVANSSQVQCNEKRDLTCSTAREKVKTKEEQKRNKKGRQMGLINNGSERFWEQNYSSNPSPIIRLH